MYIPSWILIIVAILFSFFVMPKVWLKVSIWYNDPARLTNFKAREKFKKTLFTILFLIAMGLVAWGGLTGR